MAYQTTSNEEGELKSMMVDNSTHGNRDNIDLLNTQFKTDGFVVLSKRSGSGEQNSNSMLELEFESIQRDIDQQFQACFKIMHSNGHVAFPAPLRKKKQNTSREEHIEYSMNKGVKNGFSEIVMRNKGRFELSLSPTQFGQSHPFLNRTLSGPCITADNNNCTTQVPILSQLLSTILENNYDQNCRAKTGAPSYHLINLSAVIATPGTEEQKWHADGGHMDTEQHLPCHCLNVFIPLVDMSVELGPTEFRPGTHYHTRNLAPMILAAKARKTLRPPVLPILKKGDMLIFDYRVLHRGKKNLSLHQNRTVLVMTFSKKWFKDVLNYPRRSITSSFTVDGTKKERTRDGETKESCYGSKDN